MQSTAMTPITQHPSHSVGVIDLEHLSDTPDGAERLRLKIEEILMPHLSDRSELVAKKIWALIGTCASSDALQRKTILQVPDYIEDPLTIFKNEWFAKQIDVVGQLYRTLIDQNYTAATYNLGKLLCNNAEVGSSEHHEAIGYIQKAARNNYASAKLRMAEYHLSFYCPGNGEVNNVVVVSDDNLATAIRLAQELLTQGYKKVRAAEIVCDAAEVFFRKGTEDYVTQAISLFKQAAEAGNSSAIVQMGKFYERGEGGFPKNPTMAAQLYSQGAELKNPFGCYRLACCYYYGFGVQKDLSQAVKWYRLSRDLGPETPITRAGLALLILLEKCNCP